MSKKNSENSESNRGRDGRFLPGESGSSETQFKPGQHWRPDQVFRNKEYLIQEYVTKQRSTGEIAKEHGVTDAAILHWLRKHEIPRRTVSGAREAKKWGSPGAKNPMYGRCGDQNPRWIDGRTPERQRMYARSFWKELIEVVLERDGRKCQRCGAVNTRVNRLHAHHVKPWTKNPESRFELSNIITVCKECHTWIHSKGNTENEFLSP